MTDVFWILTENSMCIQKDEFEGKLSDIKGAVIGAFFQVHKEPGYGFNEKVYENSLAFTLEESGFHVKVQAPIKVYYHFLVEKFVISRKFRKLRGIRIL